MKKILIAVIIAGCFYSCKKDNPANQQQPTTWITGKWKRTRYIDTIFTSSSNTTVFGIDDFPVDINPNELTFSSSTSGTSTARGAFSYSLTPSTFVYNVAPTLTWHIVQMSPTQLKLTTSYSEEGWNDTYVKE